MSNPGDFSPPPISSDDLQKYFPLNRPEPIKTGAFEVALTLAGTVSAGAYTAGVLDYLLEALDRWQRAKDSASPHAPKHETILSTITGASGGAINGAIFSRVAGFAFPHGPVAGNPFYSVWVNGAGISDLLAPEKASNGFRSLFNTAKFSDIANKFVIDTGPELGSDDITPSQRSFLADPLRLTATVGNVTGIPYRISFRGETKLGHDLVGHADYVRFGLTVPGGVPNDPQQRPDEFALASNAAANWDIVAATVLATSAFPAAFPSRPIGRAPAMLGYRVAVVPGVDQNTAEIAQLIPLWDTLASCVQGGELNTTNVDGGTVNNEPLDLARVSLAGYNGRNNRKAQDADRAVVLIDPFSDPETLGPSTPPGFLKLLGPLVNTLVYQARMKPEDIALASDYDTYSRFLVAPYGPGSGVTPVAGSSAIAAGGLGGFLGFISGDLLDYDFRLGRRNAYEFLSSEFVLAENNPLFNSNNWTLDQRNDYQVPEYRPGPDRPAYYLPVIPLMPELRASPPALPKWPRQPGVPAALPDQVQIRLDSVFGGLKNDLQASGDWPGGLGAFAINQAWNLYLRGKLRDKMVGAFQQGLNDQMLLTTTVQKFALTVEGKALADAARQEWLSAGAKNSAITSDKQNWILTTAW